jgi:hypothetical protein
MARPLACLYRRRNRASFHLRLHGSFRVYEVELPSGRVVKSFAQAASKKMFAGDLPWDLSAAPNDDWEADPKTCSPRR